MTAPVSTDVIAKAIELACRAPSLHNSQPWRWTVDRDVVNLFADPTRVVRSHDSSGWEAIVSCGVALDHFRIAMAAAGWQTSVDEFPDPDRPDQVASIRVTRRARVTRDMRDHADAILRRYTDRLPLGAPDDWDTVEQTLPASDLVSVDVLTDDALPILAEVSRLTDAVRYDDDYYQAELDWWTASFRLSEGIPSSASMSSSEARRVPANRGFRHSGTRDRRSGMPRDNAKVLVLSTRDDTREHALECGRVLSSVLLTCTTVGLSTCPMTHITELEAGRDILRQLIGRNTVPLILVRVGTAPLLDDMPAPTPRRPLSEVLEIR